MEKLNTYTKQQIEENLPDYLFGKLSDEEKVAFENELNNYPDLILLTNKLKKTYSELNDNNILKSTNAHTLDMPVRVLNRLRKKRPNRKITLLSKGFYYAIPVAAAVLIAYLFLPLNLTKNVHNTGSLQNISKTIFSFKENELQELENTDALLAAYEGYSYRNKSINDEENSLLEELSIENYSSLFDETSSKTLEKEIIPTFNYDKSENSYIDLTNENELQTILKELENVNFKS